VPVNLPQVKYSSIDWGDFDNDNDLDFVISGSEISLVPCTEGIACPPSLTQIFQNDKGSFSRHHADLANLFFGDARWVDFDNDNHLDLYISGTDGGSRPTSPKMYRNENGNFVDIKANITHTHQGKSDWGDYDRDGDVDLVISGFSQTGSIPLLRVVNNDHGYFSELNQDSFQGLFNSSVSWGDYDNDGDLDLVAVGDYNDLPARIYQNRQCGFELIAWDINMTAGDDVAWGDYDNDGDLDILVSGVCNRLQDAPAASPFTKIFQNLNGHFVDTKTELIQLARGSVAWADFDNDGDLDFIMSGYYPRDIFKHPSDLSYKTLIYSNDLRQSTFRQNTPPSAPTNFRTFIQGNTINLSWDSSTDSETESSALTYNVYIEDLDRNKLLVSPNSNPANGYRKIVAAGNAGYNRYFQMQNLAPGNYAWSVQAVDNGFSGSSFGQTQLFSINSDAIPNVITPNGDGFNENFIIGFGRSGWSLDVINRWGQTVHHAANYQNDWDGNGLSSGVYYYSLRNACGEVQFKGILTILD
jgi:hypothetical protein